MKLHIYFSAVLILLGYSSEGALAQENRQGCPLISISRVEVASTVPTLMYKANIQSGDSSVTPRLNWTVSAGKITGGQGTSEVSVDAEGNNSITVTVEVSGYASNCPNKAAYTFVADRVMSRKFDEYSDLKLNEERLRLDQFAVALHNEPNSKGYIIVYDATDTRKSEARQRGERAKNYLVKERGLQEAQIVVVNGGRRDTRCVELFITPPGALPPSATPRISP